MSLNKPEPMVTPGPTWAQMLNTILDLIDAHDHSSGKGALVHPAGMNIDSDLSFNNNDATNLRSARLAALSAALTGAGEAGGLNMFGGDLYFCNGSGASVRLTSGASIVTPSISNAFATTTPGAYPYTISGSDAQRMLLTDTNAARTYNLPAATTQVFFFIKDLTGLAETNPITVHRAGSDTIDSTAADVTLRRRGGMWMFISDGVSNWSSAGLLGVPLAGDITAAGTTQGTATTIANTPSLLHSGSAAAGFVLMSNIVGHSVEVTALDACLIYPPSGWQINALAANLPVTVPAGVSARFFVVGSARYGCVFSDPLLNLRPGNLIMQASDNVPTGFLLCDGTAVSRTTYAALFAEIGVLWGAGNGTTTFNLPDMRQRFALGKAAAGTGQTIAQLGGNIDHTHPLSSNGWADLELNSNVLYAHLSAGHSWTADARLTGGTTANDSSGRTQGLVLGGVTDYANPPYAAINYMIKY